MHQIVKLLGVVGTWVSRIVLCVDSDLLNKVPMFVLEGLLDARVDLFSLASILSVLTILSAIDLSFKLVTILTADCCFFSMLLRFVSIFLALRPHTYFRLLIQVFNEFLRDNNEDIPLNR